MRNAQLDGARRWHGKRVGQAGCPLHIARAGDDAPRARGARARRHFCLDQVLWSCASLDKREARVAGRQGAAALDRLAPFCELYLHAGDPAHWAPHDGAALDQSATAKHARVRRQRPRRQRRDGCEQNAARRHPLTSTPGSVRYGLTAIAPTSSRTSP